MGLWRPTVARNGQRSKSRIWWGSYYDPLVGRTIRVSLRTSNKEAARRRLLDLEKEAIDRAAGRTPTSAAERSVPELAEEFRHHLEAAGRSSAYVCQRLQQIHDFVQSVGWETVQPPPTVVQVDRWMNRLRGRGLAPSSCSSYASAAKAFVGWLIRRGYLSRNPLAHFKTGYRPAVRVRGRRALTADEQRRLLEGVRRLRKRRGLTGEQRYWWYRLALETGLRASELRQLKPSWFRWGRMPAVCLPAAATKNRQQATIPLRPQTAEALEAWVRPQWRLGRLPRHMAPVLRADCRELGIPCEGEQRVDFHCLRYTFLTNLARAGMHPAVAQRLARHADVRLTLEVYTQVGAEDLWDAVRKL